MYNLPFRVQRENLYGHKRTAFGAQGRRLLSLNAPCLTRYPPPLKTGKQTKEKKQIRNVTLRKGIKDKEKQR